ncbi:PTS sugar transporter subunit IIB [Oceanivirga salmonicida]|uniref:PTS sugar transporter subunit IIB n=1 Tax=Oceanivirga salmonicida TaxID=1769291 RepID=UPI00082FCE3E|nr:PTS sugar transporter subunit IIB [Oceanivirga salmonicida]
MKILFVCSAGMSSAIAAKALKKEGEKAGLAIEVKECSTQAFEDEILNIYDLVMVAPQIRHRYSLLKEISDSNKIPCILIEPQGYSPLGGPKMLKQVKQELNL